MGCDGGTIPRRDELVRVKKKPEQKDKESELSFRWRHCAISQQPLQAPIVACGLGRIYCKESILECLLDRSKLPDTAAHITSLKDVRELVLTTNPSYARERGGEKGESGRYVDHRTSPYACPVIGLELSGKFRFAFPWTCGCVVSEKALKEVPSKLCHKCQLPVSEGDFVFLNAEGELLEKMRLQMEARKAQMKANKKNKKQKKSVLEATVTSESIPEVETKPSDNGQDEVVMQISEDVSHTNTDSKCTNTVENKEHGKNISEQLVATTSKEDNIKDQIEKVEEVKIKTEKLDNPDKSVPLKRSRSPDDKSRRDHKHRSHDRSQRDEKDKIRSSKDHRSSRDHKSSRGDSGHRSSKDRKHKERKSSKLDSISDPAYKKAKLEYSVADDPRASSVYKSLFTTHADAKSQTKAHWVTYNPFYN